MPTSSARLPLVRSHCGNRTSSHRAITRAPNVHASSLSRPQNGTSVLGPEIGRLRDEPSQIARSGVLMRTPNGSSGASATKAFRALWPHEARPGRPTPYNCPRNSEVADHGASGTFAPEMTAAAPNPELIIGPRPEPARARRPARTADQRTPRRGGRRDPRYGSARWG